MGKNSDALFDSNEVTAESIEQIALDELAEVDAIARAEIEKAIAEDTALLHDDDLFETDTDDNAIKDIIEMQGNK